MYHDDYDHSPNAPKIASGEFAEYVVTHPGRSQYSHAGGGVSACGIARFDGVDGPAPTLEGPPASSIHCCSDGLVFMVFLVSLDSGGRPSNSESLLLVDTGERRGLVRGLFP